MSLQAVSKWLSQHLPFKIISKSSLDLLAEVGEQDRLRTEPGTAALTLCAAALCWSMERPAQNPHAMLQRQGLADTFTPVAAICGALRTTTTSLQQF
jgi:hypothetical protein